LEVLDYFAQLSEIQPDDASFPDGLVVYFAQQQSTAAHVSLGSDHDLGLWSLVSASATSGHAFESIRHCGP
jgi:hypothetical protein